MNHSKDEGVDDNDQEEFSLHPLLWEKVFSNFLNCIVPKFPVINPNPCWTFSPSKSGNNFRCDARRNFTSNCFLFRNFFFVVCVEARGGGLNLCNHWPLCSFHTHTHKKKKVKLKLCHELLNNLTFFFPSWDISHL